MLEDKQLIQLYKAGNHEAVHILIERYKSSLYKFCYHLVLNNHDADDLFQDTWVKAIKLFYSYEDSNQFKAWLFKITLNTYRDRYRKAKRWLNRIKTVFVTEEHENEIAEVEGTDRTVEEQIVDKELKDSLKDAVNKLNDTLRIPIMLFYFKELSYENIADILEIPVGTVKSRLNAGKAKLREIMEVKEIG